MSIIGSLATLVAIAAALLAASALYVRALLLTSRIGSRVGRFVLAACAYAIVAFLAVGSFAITIHANVFGVKDMPANFSVAVAIVVWILIVVPAGWYLLKRRKELHEAGYF